jgi:hypothetical protein
MDELTLAGYCACRFCLKPVCQTPSKAPEAQ